MSYLDPNDPNAMNPNAMGGNAPGGANAQQGFLGGLKSAAMGLGGAGKQALLGTPTVQQQPGANLGQMNGQQMTGPPQLTQGPNQGGLLGNLGQNLMNNKTVGPMLKFGKSLASYF